MSETSENPPQEFTQVAKVPSIQKATFWHVYFLGISMKLGGCTIAWNYGYEAGFHEYLYATIGIGFAYAMLALCMAEMVSIMSFSGGYYGYARCALGPVYGFLVGCSGAMESIFYLAMYVLKIGQFAMIFFDVPSHQQPFIWVFTYFILVILHLFTGKYFWNATFLIGASTFILVIVYILGSIPNLDYEKYASHSENSTAAGQGEFLTVFRLAALFYLGFDMITLTSNEIKDAKKVIPVALLSLIGTLLVLAIALVFVVASQYPGVSEELYQTSTFFPLAFGYERIFKINHKQAIFISAIPTFVTALGYLHIVGRQIKSMSTSGLLPPIFKKTHGPEETPVYAMAFVATLAFLANLFAWAEGIYTSSSRISTMAGCFVYVSMFYCFIVFRRRYGHLERSFHNPLGIWSAILGISVFAIMFILMVLIRFRLYFKISMLYFVYMFFMMIYYYSYAESRQCFSASEQKVFFKAYILNMQMKKKKAMKHRFASGFSRFFSFNSSVNSILSPGRSRANMYQQQKSDNSRNEVSLSSVTPRSILSSSLHASTMPNTTYRSSHRIIPISHHHDELSLNLSTGIQEDAKHDDVSDGKVSIEKTIISEKTAEEFEKEIEKETEVEKQEIIKELLGNENTFDQVVRSFKDTNLENNEVECQF